MATEYRPVQRTQNLVVQDVDGETIVYNVETRGAVRLNGTAAEVWRACNGATSVADIARQLRVASDVSEDLVWLALRDLEAQGLVEPAQVPTAGTLTRRQLAMRLGAGSLLLLPLVSALSVSVSAQVPGTIPSACQQCVDATNCGVCGGYTGTCYNSADCGSNPLGVTTCSQCVGYFGPNLQPQLGSLLWHWRAGQVDLLR